MDIKQQLGDLVELHKPHKSQPAELPRVTVKHQAKPCSDCELSVVDRRIEYRHRTTPEAHWSEKCMYCKLMKHPETGEFSVDSRDYLTIYKHIIELRAK